ncbi:CatA-like O-acetyltransferase [Lacinutrix sp. Hel_I_90]|uniref:CatA-like O-acetyltransferase n=1 Tax=Lacinutrix sp. Hel_I_90 TaxID=1249999 RepID=UPI0005CB2174|nr:CatA-like O-acetyltransferase [Lacinutrix sp. Hel_I_90]
MKTIDLNIWSRALHFQHFNALASPYLRFSIPFNVTEVYAFAKREAKRFFAACLHAGQKAIISLDNLRYKTENKEVVDCALIHASAPLLRVYKPFGFSFTEYDNDPDQLNSEKNTIERSNDLYPPQNGLNCVHCSAMPWFKFSGQKESVLKSVFSKYEKAEEQWVMTVSISLNHALVERYYESLFPDAFQEFLNAKAHKFD